MVDSLMTERFSRSFLNPQIWVSAVPLFLLINQISPTFNLSFSSQRLAFIIFLILNLFHLRQFKVGLRKSDLAILLLSVFLMFYSLLVSVVFESDFIQSSRFFHFVLFSLVGPFLVFWLITDEIRFHKSVVVATLIQVLFVILTYSSSSFTNWLFVYIDSGSQALSGARAPGLSSSGGAALSVVLSLGALSVLRLSDFVRRVWHLSALILIICAAALVGRTGMLVSVVCLVLLIFKGRVSVKSLVVSILTVGFSVIVVFDAVRNNPQFLGYTLSWALSVFTGSDQTVSILFGQDVKELNERILLFGGVGVSDPHGGNASGSDVGYMQVIYSIGLPLSIAFYLGYFFYLSSFKVERNDNDFKWILIFMVFLLELKEPFIFKYAVSFYTLASIFYMSRVRAI